MRSFRLETVWGAESVTTCPGFNGRAWTVTSGKRAKNRERANCPLAREIQKILRPFLTWGDSPFPERPARQGTSGDSCRNGTGMGCRIIGERTHPR